MAGDVKHRASRSATLDWPVALLEHCQGKRGAIRHVEQLGGMSLARVFRAHFADSSVIVKATKRPLEPAFYAVVAPGLRQAGVPIPDLELAVQEHGVHWLVIEDLPHPFAAPGGSDWSPDDGLVQALARLHTHTRGRVFDLPKSHVGQWSGRDTSVVLSSLQLETAAACEPLLRYCEEAAGNAAAPWCWISGDPNPANWARRHDGTLALFDWELFRPGMPATDLAICIPGLPDVRMFHRGALAYAAQCENLGVTLPWPETELVRDMAVAKVGTVVMLLAASASKTAHVPDGLRATLQDRLPGWLGTIRSAIQN